VGSKTAHLLPLLPLQRTLTPCKGHSVKRVSAWLLPDYCPARDCVSDPHLANPRSIAVPSS
jgi:hypothetical protein